MIVPTIHARERLQLRVDPTLSDEEAWALLWEVARQLPDSTKFWCGELGGKPAGLPVQDGLITSVWVPGEPDPTGEAVELVATVVAA